MSDATVIVLATMVPVFGLGGLLAVLVEEVLPGLARAVPRRREDRLEDR